VIVLEPPRASSPIVDDRVPVSIELPLPTVSRDPIDVVPSVASRRSSGASRVVSAQPPSAVSAEPPADAPGAQGGPRRSPTQGVTVRPHAGGIPTTRSGAGRALPRAYVARRNTGSRGRGPTTPPRSEPQQLDASGSGRPGGSSREGNGASPRAGGVSPRADRIETPLPAPSNDLPVKAREPAVAAALGMAPDRADDPHGEPLMSAGETATLAERVAHEPVPQVEGRQAAAGEPRGPSPISEVTPSRAAAFRTRTAMLARLAVTTAHQRRALIAALLGVALLSASAGILAGKWLAARTTAAQVRR
jgi:hypothetical protein